LNERNTTIRQSAGQNTVGDYNTTPPSPVRSVAVNAVNGVNAANAAKPPDAVEAAATAAATAASPPSERRFQPLVPLKGQEGKLPPFPVDCLPAVLRDYVRAVAEHSQTAVDMAAVIGLGVLAVCLQGKYVVEGTPGYTYTTTPFLHQMRGKICLEIVEMRGGGEESPALCEAFGDKRGLM
jgi:hypothetical protein